MGRSGQEEHIGGTIADLQRYVNKLTILLVNVFCHRNQKKARKSQKIDMNLTKSSEQRDPPGARDGGKIFLPGFPSYDILRPCKEMST